MPMIGAANGATLARDDSREVQLWERQRDGTANPKRQHLTLRQSRRKAWAAKQRRGW